MNFRRTIPFALALPLLFAACRDKPAAAPLMKPAKDGTKGAPSKPGLMMSTLPSRAVSTPPICTAVGFSRSRSTEKMMAKKGESLLSILASASTRWLKRGPGWKTKLASCG